jgi:hypothetical protein
VLAVEVNAENGNGEQLGNVATEAQQPRIRPGLEDASVIER